MIYKFFLLYICIYISGPSFSILEYLHFLVLRSQTSPHFMYGSMDLIVEISSYSYITLMCTIFMFLIFFLSYMSRDYCMYYIFTPYVLTHKCFTLLHTTTTCLRILGVSKLHAMISSTNKN